MKRVLKCTQKGWREGGDGGFITARARMKQKDELHACYAENEQGMMRWSRQRRDVREDG